MFVMSILPTNNHMARNLLYKYRQLITRRMIMKKIITLVFAGALMLASVSAFASETDKAAAADSAVKKETASEVKTEVKADTAQTDKTAEQPAQQEVKPN